ncbi:MAG: hypothetical protein JWP87_4355 [Labilithrix sp.]|nr:hypothetical protein [Labilithrix sp.]
MRPLYLLVCLGLVACTADAESSDPTSVPGSPADAPAPAAGAPFASSAHASVAGTAFAVPSAQPAAFVCRKGAFCEDFEEQGYASHWKSAFTTGDGILESNTESASVGRGSLRLFTKDAASSAYLLSERGTVSGNWSGVLGFAFRVAEVPHAYLGGPELTVKTPDGPIVIRVSMTPEGVFVEQHGTAECLRDRCVDSRTLLAPAHANHWYRITLGLEVNPHQAAPYGRLEASVDQGDVLSTDLNVPFYDGSVFLSAGLTEGDPGRRALADLDDVSLLVR